MSGIEVGFIVVIIGAFVVFAVGVSIADAQSCAARRKNT